MRILSLIGNPFFFCLSCQGIHDKFHVWHGNITSARYPILAVLCCFKSDFLIVLLCYASLLKIGQGLFLGIHIYILCVHAKSLTLCDPVNCNPPGSSVHGIFQARILEWLPCPPPGALPDPGIEPPSLSLLHWQASSLPLAPLCSRTLAPQRVKPPTHLLYVTERVNFSSFSSVTQSCPTLCRPMDCSTPAFPVHHQLPELAQTHVHRVGDAIQPPHPLSSPSPPAFNFSQHQDLLQWVSSPHQVTKVLKLQLQRQSFQWIFRTDFL